MKLFKYISVAVIAMIAFTFSSCNDNDYSIGTPFDKVEGTIGEWAVQSVTLVNEVSKEEMDITPYFDFGTFRININEDKTFAITGDAPNFVGVNSGTWELDNNETPMALILKENDVTSQFSFVAPPRKGTNLKFRFERMVDDEAVTSYVYELTKN